MGTDPSKTQHIVMGLPTQGFLGNGSLREVDSTIITTGLAFLYKGFRLCTKAKRQAGKAVEAANFC